MYNENHIKKAKLLCTETYVEDGIEFWSRGNTYEGSKFDDGTCIIETNFGTFGRVGNGYMIEEVEDNFEIIEKEDL